MKFIDFVIPLLSVAVIGCSKSYTRFGSSAEIPRASTDSVSSRSSTNTSINFGRVLQNYLGKPYAGRSKYDPGLDCSLFTAEVFKKYAGIQLPRTSEDQFKSGSHVKNERMAFGDLVFFHTNGGGVSHVGVFIGHDEFIHASSSNGVIISSIKEKHWAKRFVGARRVIE
ncbi:MAG: C40 family peptidase [Candidatus Zixiibacteriota bacterium]